MKNEIKDLEEKYFKKLFVKKSNISGSGLFAGEPIKKGEIILVFGGCIGVNESRYSGDFIRSTCTGINDYVFLGEPSTSEKQISDYINHSCDPNIGMLDAITVVAIKDIKMNEELLCDYSFWENNEEWVMKHECTCGSPHCRRNITGRDWKNVKSSDANFNFFSPYIRRRILNNEKK